MRHLMYFIDVADDSRVVGNKTISDFIGITSKGIVQYARNEKGQYGSVWWHTDSNRSKYAVHAHSSAIDGLLAAAKVCSLCADSESLGP